MGEEKMPLLELWNETICVQCFFALQSVTQLAAVFCK